MNSLNGQSTHDPIERAAEGEPHLILLARDWRSPDLARYYGAMRAGNLPAMDDIHKRMKENVAKRPINFDKDRAHQRSASAVATNMELWAEEQRLKLQDEALES